MMYIYLGIGTNLGQREANIERALLLLDERVGQRGVCSPVYYSAPQGFVSDNEFANIVVAYTTTLSPMEVLHITQAIEREMGRTTKSHHGVYHDRIIDIDLLMAMDGNTSITIQHEELILPHPRMQERAFVMEPMRYCLALSV